MARPQSLTHRPMSPQAVERMLKRGPETVSLPEIYRRIPSASRWLQIFSARTYRSRTHRTWPGTPTLTHLRTTDAREREGGSYIFSASTAIRPREDGALRWVGWPGRNSCGRKPFRFAVSGELTLWKTSGWESVGRTPPWSRHLGGETSLMGAGGRSNGSGQVRMSAFVTTFSSA